MQLYSMAMYVGTGVAGVGRCAIDVNGGEADELVCAAVQEDTTGFYGFLFDL